MVQDCLHKGTKGFDAHNIGVVIERPTSRAPSGGEGEVGLPGRGLALDEGSQVGPPELEVNVGVQPLSILKY